MREINNFLRIEDKNYNDEYKRTQRRNTMIESYRITSM